MLQILGAPTRVRGAEAARETARASRSAVRLRVRRNLRPADVAVLSELIDDPSRWRDLPKLATSHRSSVARVTLPSGSVVVKRYREPALFRLRTFGRFSRAEREARAMDLVASALFESPVRVLAWAEDRRLGFVASSHLVVSELAGSFDLRAVRSLDSASRARAAELVLEKLPGMVAALHDAGIFCGGSLRGKNVLVQPDHERVAIIDQIAASAPRRLRTRHRTRDLATLSLELRRFLDDAQWQAFLERYREAALDLSQEEWGRLSVDRIARVARRVAHRTLWTAAVRGVKRRLRRSRLGRWSSGRSLREGKGR